MSVSNYTPSSAICKYTYSKLKDVIYLVSKDHLKDVHIDNGEAYISGLTELPLRLNGFNIQLNEESSLDERYKFQKTVTLSMHKYVNSSIFGGRYYVILESTDGTFWMVNVDFPSRVTYTFNLSQNQYQTDFTLSSLSNFPTLKLNGNFEAEEPVCLGFNVYGIQSLKLLEKDLCSLDTANKVVTTYTSKDFQTIEYLGESCSLQESFDGRKVSTQIQFNIGFDAYKSSWHYNLLEFVQNLYSAIIVPKGSDNTFFAGFNFGLQPSFVVQTQSEAGASDIITITLVEASNHGSTAAVDWSEEQETTTRWIYPKTIGNTICWECVGFGTAKYLVQQEVTVNGTPTGNYKVLEGYESQFPNLNIVGTFSNIETFSNYECGGEQCNVSTNLPLTITYNAQTCYTYSYSASCDWNVSNVPSYITVSPSNGSANSAYTLTVCNTKTPTSGETSSFTITSGNNSRVVNVVLTPESSILTPQTQYINCLQQNVTFAYDTSCPITVTSIDQRLTYQITNSQFVVNVPRNNSTTSAITWSIDVKDCHNNSGTSYIVQDKTYEKWVNTSGYICESGNSYVEQVRYTGTTSSNTNTMTSEYRKGDLIQSGDSRCTTEYTRWTRNSTDYYCIDGDKWSFDEQEVSNDGTNWTKNGNTRLGEMVESASSFCSESVQYKWVLTDRWVCDGSETKFKATYSGGTSYSAECTSSADTLTTATTKPSGYVYSAMTSAEIGDCVTSIGDWAFGSCTSLTSCTIGSGVTIIGSYSFYNCSGLTSIDIPDSVTSIGQQTFYGCRSLTSCTIGSGVTSIDNWAFQNCRSLTSIGIPNSVTSIGGYAFGSCTSLTSCTIGSGVTIIGSYSFYNCSGLTSIDIPDNVTSIGGYVFYNCSNLTACTIGSGVTSINNSAFNGCSGLTSITVNATTPPELGSNVFVSTNNCTIYVPCSSVATYKSASGWSTYADRIQGIPPCGEPPTPTFDGKFRAVYSGGTSYSAECTSSADTLTTATTKPSGYEYSAMTSAEIGDCVTSISNGVFYNCSGLTSCTIGNNVTNISNYAFDGCSGLTTVSIPSSVRVIGESSFSDCRSLTSIIIPNGVTTIGGWAFQRCKGLSSVTIPNSVTSIGNGAFSACSGLTSIDIPSGVTSIGDSTFYGCHSLTSIDIPSGVTTIGGGAFEFCSGLTSIDIPSGVTSIGEGAFNGCRSLTSITIYATIPPTLGSNAFYNTNCPIYVPSASVNTYKSAEGWSDYASRIQAIP